MKAAARRRRSKAEARLAREVAEAQAKLLRDRAEFGTGGFMSVKQVLAEMQRRPDAGK